MSRLQSNQMLAGPPRSAASGEPLSGPITAAPDALFVVVHRAACRTVFMLPVGCVRCGEDAFPRDRQQQDVHCDWCQPE